MNEPWGVVVPACCTDCVVRMGGVGGSTAWAGTGSSESMLRLSLRHLSLRDRGRLYIICERTSFMRASERDGSGLLPANMLAPESELAMMLHELRFVKGDSFWSELDMMIESVFNNKVLKVLSEIDDEEHDQDAGDADAGDDNGDDGRAVGALLTRDDGAPLIDATTACLALTYYMNGDKL